MDEKEVKAAERVELEIFGTRLAFKTDNAEYMKKLAQIVDGEMKKTASGTRSFDSGKIAILTALHLADEYLKLKSDYDDLVELIEEK